MKTVVILIMLFPFGAFCQIEISRQPDANWYTTTWTMHQQKMIPESQLLLVKKTFAIETFQDTLRKYDWISLGGYLHVDKHYSSMYNEQNSSYDIMRLDEGDTCLYFGYDATMNEKEKGIISHTNFAGLLGTNPVWKVVKVNGKWFIKDVNNNEYLHLISYENGILIYDIPMNGKTTDTKMFSRQVLMARTRDFEWSKTSN